MHQYKRRSDHLPYFKLEQQKSCSTNKRLVSTGKKGPDLGEYDPLTQADSEDESEEDDLVLNYPRNGLGRDGCLGSGSSKLRGGRSGRLVGAEDDAPEDEEEEEEEDKWREGLKSKSKQAVGDLRATQYWSSHRDAGRDRSGEDRGGSGPLGGAVLGAHGADAEAKRVRNAVRSAFFLVPLVCAMLLVLLCAFLIPCRKGELERRMQWERALGVIPRGELKKKKQGKKTSHIQHPRFPPESRTTLKAQCVRFSITYW